MKKTIIANLAATAIAFSAIGAPSQDPLPGDGPFTSRPSYQKGHLAKFSKRKSMDQHTLVFFGDSITEWWPKFGSSFPELRVANRGIASDTTRGMLCRLQENVLDLQPQAVVILGGINDLRPNNKPPGTPATVATNYRLMLTEIQKHNAKLPLLICEILPSSICAPGLIRETNQAIEQVVNRFPNAAMVRTHDKFLNDDGTQNMALFSDGVHPNRAGYAVWKAALTPEFAKLGLKRLNPAIIPSTQGGNGYDWMGRHNAILKLKTNGIGVQS